MKAIARFAILSFGFAMPVASAASELEMLRARCADQQRQIHRLKDENLALHAKTSPPAAKDPAAKEPAAKEPAAREAGKTHKILAGETFASIARKYHVSVESLIAANPDAKATALRLGQIIRLDAKAPDAEVPDAKVSDAKVSDAKVPDAKVSDAKDDASSNPKTASEAMPSEDLPVDESPAVSPPAKTPPSEVSPEILPPAEAPPAAQAPAESLPTAETASVVRPPVPVPVSPVLPLPRAAPKVESAPAASPVSPSNKKNRPVTIEKEMTYGEFAVKHGTDIQHLNTLNGWDLTKSTVLAKGSELYVPGRP
jgi:LysM repeat protein